MLNIAKVAAKMKEHDDATVVEMISFRHEFSYDLARVLQLPWAANMYRFNKFDVVNVNPYLAAGPNEGVHFPASMEEKYATERFDRLLRRNAVKRILQPSLLPSVEWEQSQARRVTAWQSQENPFWRNMWKEMLDGIPRTVLAEHIQCLAPFEKNPDGVWVRTKITREKMAVDVVTVLSWVLKTKLVEHINVEKLENLAEEHEANMKAQNPDTFRTRKDTRNMVDAMKVCIHRGNDEKRWAHEAKEAAAAAEAARVAKKAAKAAKKRK